MSSVVKESLATGVPEVVGEIVRALASLQFGTVEITVHDSRVVQIERRERIRLDPSRTARR